VSASIFALTVGSLICLVPNGSLTKMVLTDPVACSSCGCKKKQDEDLEIVFPEVVQKQPLKKDPMIANDARLQRITHNSTSGGGSR
jgi:hypothetical protein